MNFRKILFKSLVFILLTGILHSQQIVDFEISGKVLKVFCNDVDYEIEAWTDRIVKISSYLDKKHIKDSSYTVILKKQDVNVEIFKDDENIFYKTDSLTLKIPLDYFGIDFIRNEQTLTKHIKNSFFRAWKINGIYFSLKDDEGIYGLGLKAVDINRRNLKTILRHQNLFGYEYGESWLNSNVPFFVSSEKYGIFVDNHALHYFSADSSIPNTIKYNVNSGNMNYFFVQGNNYPEILKSYSEMTGFQPLLPRWACGFFMSKTSYGNQENCMKIANSMLQGDYPLDAMVFDYSWFGYAEKMGNFTWEATEYPNPQKLISDLKKKNIKTVLISEPFVAQKSDNFSDALSNNLFVKDDNNELPSVRILGADVVLLDISKEATRKWIWGKYNARNQDGVEGWWIDLIEPEFHAGGWVHEIGISSDIHNIYSLIWAQNLYENYKKEKPNKRPFLMYRAGWSGTQRYGSVLLCGDVARSWKGLKGQIPGMLGMQMSGLAMFTTDIGGYTTSNFNPELYVRWFQFGTFSPVMRLHMGGTNRVEPYHYDQRTQGIVREFIKLRYRLLPYNYTLFWEHSETGVPPARQMNFYNDDTKLRNINDQYFWGKELLIAPVIDTNIRQRQVVLPEGNWIDFWTKEIEHGNQTITSATPLEKIPIFIKSGSFIPFIPQINNTEEYEGDTLIIEYYPDIEYPVTEYVLYDDDGKTAESNKTGQFQLIQFNGKVSKDSIQISQKSSGSFLNMPESREIFFKIYNPHLSNFDVHLNNRELDNAITKENFENQSESYYFSDNLLQIHYNFLNDDIEILITVKTNGIDNKGENRKIKIYPMPVEDFLNIEIVDFKTGKYSISIFDIEGKKLYDNIELNINEEKFLYKLDLNKYYKLNTNGTYYLRIYGNGYDEMVKFNIVR